MLFKVFKIFLTLSAFMFYAHSAFAVPDGAGNDVFPSSNVGIGTKTPQGALVITNGNVGIGTWAPTQSLDVKGNITATGTITGATISGAFSPSTLEVTGQATFNTSSSGNTGIGTTLTGGNTAKLAVIGGNVGIGTITPQGAFVVTNGNVGLGTWVPRAPLHVNGQCVTGDTRLRRRRRRADGTYDYDEVRIDAVQPGDEILSLNEETGLLEYQKIEALMDMGVKPIYKLTTTSGKSIRTTGNHPYLRAPENKGHKSKLHFAFMDETGVQFDPNGKMGVGIIVVRSNLIKMNTDLRNIFLNALNFLNQEEKMFEFKFSYITPASEKFYHQIIDVLEHHLMDWDFTSIFRPRSKHKNFLDQYKYMAYVLLEQVKGRLAVLMDYVGHSKNKISTLEDLLNIPQVQNILPVESQGTVFMQITDIVLGALAYKSMGGKDIYKGRVADRVMALLAKKEEAAIDPIYAAQKPGIENYSGHNKNITNIVTFVKGGAWTNVSELKEGDFIAVAAESAPVYERITKIELLPPEQVWDIQIANTRNFVGNDIIAHNTYLKGNVGVGTWLPTSGLDVNAEQIKLSTYTYDIGLQIDDKGYTNETINLKLEYAGAALSSTYWLRFITGGTTNPRLSIDTNGNVGIGTFIIPQGNVITPSALLSVAGNIGIGTNVSSAYVAVSRPPSGGMIVEGNVGLGTTSPQAGFVSMNNVGIGTWTAAGGNLIVNGGGNVGIGSVWPGVALDVNGTVRASGFSTTAGVAAGWTNAAGRTYVTTGSDNVGIGTSTPQGAFVVTNGNVGLGTWVPIAPLHVNGQCVTGDTRLRRRRRRADGSYDYDEVRIDQIQPGDEILSLNEQTGSLEYQKVEALMDMGVKPIYKLTTASGKIIRTTGNHPYLVRNEHPVDSNFMHDGIFMVVSSMAKEFYQQVLMKTAVRVPLLNNESVPFTRQGWMHLALGHRSRLNLLSRYMALPKVAQLLSDPLAALRYQKRGDCEYWGITGIVDCVELNVVVRSINGGQKHFYSVVWLGEVRGDKQNRTVTDHVDAVRSEKSGAVSRISQRRQGLDTLQLQIKYRSYISRLSSLIFETSTGVLNAFYRKESRAVVPYSGQWVKVLDLREGMFVAVVKGNNPRYEMIVKIEELPPEQVWDIQIANTRNFVGNDIIAHNTYINGNVGIGTSTPQGAFVVINGNVGIGTWTAANRMSVIGGVGIGTTSPSQFVTTVAPTGGLMVQGNVGIGTWIVPTTLSVKGSYSQIVVGLTDGANIATNASLGNFFRVTLGGNRVLDAPTNGTDGQRIVYEIIQDGTGTRTLDTTAFYFGTDITAATLTTTASKRDFITVIYNAVTNKWYIVGFVKGY